MRFVASLIMALALMLPALPALAVNPDEVLADPNLEHRARELSKELRCVVCQNQSIDDSDAELARDLRVIVRERLTKGDSDQEVIDYVVARYGDFVLLKPPFKGITYFLWLGPVVFVGIGIAAVAVYYRKRQTVAAENGAGSDTKKFSVDEKARLDALLKDEDDA